MKYVLTIAGFDPSNGAGLGSDIKTFEAFGVYGLSVCSAVTVQNESEFERVEWISAKLILAQISILFRKYRIDIVKIGLIEGLETLGLVVNRLKELNPNIRIIWDPILEASAGFMFHSNLDRNQLHYIAKQIYLITPNRLEWKRLFPNQIETDVSKKLCNVFLKGGHAKGRYSINILFTRKDTTRFVAIRSPKSKHGTGCVLSAAIAAELTRGADLIQACQQAKDYVTAFINSNETLLGMSIEGFKYREASAMTQLKSPLLVITQDHPSISHEEMAESACLSGVKWVQFRTKGKSEAAWRRLAISVKEVCDKYGVSLIVNDNPALVKAIGASGVHLGKTDMHPDKARKLLGENAIIGGTANTMDDVRHLAKTSVNYIGLGPFLFTSTKENLSPILGIEGYRKIIQQCKAEGIHIPIVAIGGILPNDVQDLMATGIKGIAVASAINLAANRVEACGAFMEKLRY